MKKKSIIKPIGGMVTIFMLIVVIDLNFDIIKRQINQTVPVEIYNSDATKIGDTVVTINGVYYPHIFKRDVYFGEFSLPELPLTQREDTRAEIEWITRNGYPEEPRIIHYGSTVEENLGSVFIDINREMDEIVWWTAEGTIATSNEAYSNSIHFGK